MDYKIKLEVFEGPFDLLFHLIEKNEVDIYDIPIAKITDQYVAYLSTLQSLDLEVASEFLVMAATLVQIKSRLLLPKPPRPEAGEPEPDPRDELVVRLLEYKKFKAVAALLGEREQSQGLVFTHPVNVDAYIEEFAEKNPLQGVTLSDLLDALQEVLQRVEAEDRVEEISREEITVRDKMREIIRRVILAPGGIYFRELFRGSRTRTTIVITFLALLELIRLGKVLVRQSENFAEMMICRFQAAEVYGTEVTDGFAVS